MTKKHFEAIAKILKAQNANLALVMELAAYFEFTNPNFDAERFVKGIVYDMNGNNVGFYKFYED